MTRKKLNVQYQMHYRISSFIRRCFSFQNNPKNLDPSYKTDLDLGMVMKGQTGIKAKFHRTDLVICSHCREREPRLIAELIR